MTTAHDVVRHETWINCIVSAVLAGGVAWLIFRGQSAVAAWAPPPGGIFGILPGTFNFTLLVTLALTAVIRKRYRAVAPPAVSSTAPWGWLPRQLLLRGLLLAALVTTLFVPATMLLVIWAIRLSLVAAIWTLPAMIGFFIVYFVLVTAFTTPIVVWCALRDIAPATTTAC